MTARLPDGFRARLDPAVRRAAGGRVLLGGAPLRLLRLAPAAAEIIRGDGTVTVGDDRGAAVVRHLLDAGIAQPAPDPGSRGQGVTVVVPVRDNASGVDRLLRALPGLPVVVVDDGSAQPIRPAGARVLRTEISRGPAAARNLGIAAADTELVAVLDSDVVPQPGWLDALLPHFDDPAVALAAPRIVALDPGGGARAGAWGPVARYESVRSSLDLGRRAAAVRAGTPVAYVPSAAMMLRRSAFDECGGFAPDMHVGEDVDLCWRLADAGWCLRYEPASEVAHDHRVRVWDWLRRKAFYGTSAAPLAIRHPGLVPPVAMSGATLAGVVGLATGTRVGLATAVASQAYAAVRVAGTLDGVPGRGPLVAAIVARGFLGGCRQAASAMWRHYWPITLAAGCLSRRVRRAAAGAAVADGALDWWERRRPAGSGRGGKGPDPLTHIVLLRADDIAYGAGLWRGAVTARSAAALRPRITW
ncbi:mycofactocin biosynthesis glycosyltransferase MftF [Tsukamurella soli]|uniref:Mycofactocin biosynthesis glycosyltransferase MftF n=1 Tax=Tsukamurella soli TaxID=644556 RepID=A0ABP8JXF0_9ACTN